jgi:uncharacterized protein YkwD
LDVAVGLWLSVLVLMVPVLGQAAPSDAQSEFVARIHKLSLRRGHTTLSERREVALAAQAILAQVPDGVQAPFAVIQRELLRQQVVEPVHRQIVAGFATADPGSLLSMMEPMLDQALGDRKWRWFGLAVQPVDGDSERSRLLILLVESGIDLVPPPAAPALSELPVPLRGTLLPPYVRPQVLLTDPSGQVVPLPIEAKGRQFAGQLRCQSVGLYKIEVVGESKQGPHVLANFVWPCATTLPSLPPPTVPPKGPSVAKVLRTVAESEAELLRLLNHDRQQAGLAALVLDGRLAKIARAHCEEMARKRSVFHHSPTTGTPEDRVHRAKIKGSLIAENLAQAPTEEEAERSLLDSPGHRRNILDPQLLKVGIGVAAIVTAQGTRQLYVTQLFLTE